MRAPSASAAAMEMMMIGDNIDWSKCRPNCMRVPCAVVAWACEPRYDSDIGCALAQASMSGECTGPAETRDAVAARLIGGPSDRLDEWLCSMSYRELEG